MSFANTTWLTPSLVRKDFTSRGPYAVGAGIVSV